MRRLNIVLHDQHQHLHDVAQPDAEHEGREGEFPVGGVRAESAEQEQPDGRDCGAQDGEDSILAPTGDDLAAGHGGDEQTTHERQEHQTGFGGGGTVDHLQVHRQVDDGAEHREADDEADGGRQGEGPGAEEAQIDDRLRGAALLQHEGQDGNETADDEADDCRRRPRVFVPTPHRDQQQHRDTGHQQGRAEPVDSALLVPHGDVQNGAEHDEGGDAQGQVDVEDPTPGEVFGEQAAEQRTDHRGDAEHGPEQPHVTASFARRDDVADDGHDEHHQPAAADPLQCSEADQLRHALRQAGEG